ncbi:creatininase family protein [Halobaculum sp. MBLA0147]|uniref:creatininase family protein n=1 Tax=Halobaculum sp. MBLA0147 TaxID=3079934 RepID=UPI0035247031
MNLSEATWTEFEAAAPDVALVPVGSTEQHGPHAPLGTDTLNAVAVAEAADERLGGEVDDDVPEGTAVDGRPDENAADDSSDEPPSVVVAPPIHVGVSEEHRAFPGTLWVSPDTFRSYVRETAESLATHGVDRVVFVNGHGGNVEALAEVARELSRSETGPYAVAFTWFEAVGDHGSDMGHAGPLETALLRHTTPESIREDRVAAAAADAADRWGEWVRGVNLTHDSDAFTENGVVGDPTAGDAERGAELLDLAAASLCEVVRAVAEREP